MTHQPETPSRRGPKPRPAPTSFRHLSDRQQTMMRYIHRFIKQMGYSPSIREIAPVIGSNSTQVVTYNLTQLIQWGYLDKADGRARSLRVLITPPNEIRSSSKKKGEATLSINVELSGPASKMISDARAVIINIEAFIEKIERDEHA